MKRVRMTMKAKRVRIIHIRFVKPNVFWLRRETFSSYSCVSVGEPLARGGEMCAAPFPARRCIVFLRRKEKNKGEQDAEETSTAQG